MLHDKVALSGSEVFDPFQDTPRHGTLVNWVAVSRSAPEDIISGPMNHYDAARILINDRMDDPDHMVVRRQEFVGRDPMVTGRSFSSNHASQSPLDLTPALPFLSDQDVVNLINEDFGPGGETTAKILSILNEQGDPRAERLFMYTTLWSSPDDQGRRPEACLQVNKDDLMAYLEVRRPELHDEMCMRMDPPGYSICD